MAFVDDPTTVRAIAEYVVTIAREKSFVMLGERQLPIMNPSHPKIRIPASAVRFMRAPPTTNARLITMKHTFIRSAHQIHDILEPEDIVPAGSDVVVLEQHSDYSQDILILIACGYMPVVMKQDVCRFGLPDVSPSEDGELPASVEAQAEQRTLVLLSDPVVKKLHFHDDGVVPDQIDLVSPDGSVQSDAVFVHPTQWPWESVWSECHRVPHEIMEVARDYAIADHDEGRWCHSLKASDARDLVDHYITHAMAMGREARADNGPFTGLNDQRWKCPM
jgi:hypothetical protein